MRALSKSVVFASMALLAACVTINVYFPAAAAEKAADRIIRDVYGETLPGSEQMPESESELAPTSQYKGGQPIGLTVFVALLDLMVSPAYAAPNISIETPAIQKIKAAMTSRHRSLDGHYKSGAVGMTEGGLITVRDLNSVRLPDRRRLQQLVADESRDRNALYKEIARANNHPEWEKEIRSTFARRWISNAPKGWWYKQGSTWKQK